MKTKSVILTLVLGSALAGLTGCNKSEPAPDTTATNAPSASMADQMKEAVSGAATETKEAAAAAVEKTKEVAAGAVEKTKEAVAEVKEKVEGTGESMMAQAQGLIDKAKALVGESKYKEALDALQGLASFKLTEEQQKAVDGLKEQIQKGLGAVGITNSVSGLLGK